MKSRYYLSVILFFIFSLCYSQTNTLYQDSLMKVYPDAENVIWSESGIFHIAQFELNEFSKKVWFDNNAKWIMSVTDLETTDELPSNVYTVFMFTQYSQWNVLNVYWIQFPSQQEQYIVKVNQDNSSESFYIFFEPGGKVINTLNISNQDIPITPSLFGIN